MAIITDISVQKKKGDRVNIYVDGLFFCGMSAFTVIENKLKPGMTIERDKLVRVQYESEKDTALSKAMGFIAVALKTKKQMQIYLTGKGYLPEIVTYVIEKLEEYGHIDDEKYAEVYTEQYLGSKSVRAIRFELSEKGVPKSVIDKVTAECDELDACQNAAEKYLRGKSNSDTLKLKARQNLASKGYSYDTINEVLSKIFDGGDYEEEY